MTDGRPKRAPPDPFAGVEAKSVTEIEIDEGVKVARVQLPDAAKLTDLPMIFLLAAVVMCAGATLIGQLVEAEHLHQIVHELGLPHEEPAGTATPEPVDQLKQDRLALQKRVRELKQRQRNFEKSTRASPATVQPEPEERGIPLTIEAVREELRLRAGENFEAYRRFATLIALLVGGLGLILLAVFVRVLWAAIFGAAAFGLTFALELNPWVVWTATLLAGSFGAWLGPKLLLAAVLTNTTLAGTVLGGLAVGGGVYLLSGNELYALVGLGAGVVLGAVAGFKYARPLFLSAVVANTAGVAALTLWLLWGDLFPYFWPVTMGGLMLFDGLATRLYHRMRWGN